MNPLLNNRDCSPAHRRPGKAQVFSALALLAALAFAAAAAAGDINHN
jgi:hypothetical protein